MQGSHFCKCCLKQCHPFCGDTHGNEGYGCNVTCFNCTGVSINYIYIFFFFLIHLYIQKEEDLLLVEDASKPSAKVMVSSGEFPL